MPVVAKHRAAASPLLMPSRSVFADEESATEFKMRKIVEEMMETEEAYVQSLRDIEDVCVVASAAFFLWSGLSMAHVRLSSRASLPLNRACLCSLIPSVPDERHRS